MTDIVERLQRMAGIETSALYSQRKTLNEAADEIKRLRTALDKALNNCRFCGGSGKRETRDIDTGACVKSEPCEACEPLRALLDPKDI